MFEIFEIVISNGSIMIGLGFMIKQEQGYTADHFLWGNNSYLSIKLHSSNGRVRIS